MARYLFPSRVGGYLDGFSCTVSFLKCICRVHGKGADGYNLVIIIGSTL